MHNRNYGRLKMGKISGKRWRVYDRSRSPHAIPANFAISRKETNVIRGANFRQKTSRDSFSDNSMLRKMT